MVIGQGKIPTLHAVTLPSGVCCMTLTVYEFFMNVHTEREEAIYEIETLKSFVTDVIAGHQHASLCNTYIPKPTKSTCPGI
jgi:hypothetical protein